MVVVFSSLVMCISRVEFLRQPRRLKREASNAAAYLRMDTGNPSAPQGFFSIC